MGKVFCLPVRANAPAAASHPPERDRVRAPNEPAHKCAALPRFSRHPPARKKTRMATACLIALAVSGLILIVLWEIFS
jgi:hypothetical protein